MKRTFTKAKTGSLVGSVMVAGALFVSGVAFGAETMPAKVMFMNDNSSVADSLTGAAGDAAAGRKVFANRKQGNCLACHANSEMKEQSFHGEIGPSLDGVAKRRKPAELRAILVDSKKALNEDTIMPGFYTLNVGVRVKKKFKGKTVLSAKQVEDVLAYLETLK